MQSAQLTAYQRGLQTVLLGMRPAALASLLKQALGVRRTVIETPRGRFWVDICSNLGAELSRHGAYEPDMERLLDRFLAPGGVFVDVGANEGYFTALAARRCGPTGRVLAIEPQERLLPIIAENLRLNGTEWATVLPIAVTDAEGVAKLYLTADVNSGASGLHRRTRYPLPTRQVATKTLAQALDDAGLGRVDLMKIDIEGFEYEAVLGSPEVFQRGQVRALALELHPAVLASRHKDAADIIQMLAQCGYSLTERFGSTVWLAPA